MESIAEFLDGMPSYDIRNFSRFRSNSGQIRSASIYTTTSDSTSGQIIVSDKTNLLIRYLRIKNQEKKKHSIRKREYIQAINEADELIPNKVQRLDLDE